MVVYIVVGFFMDSVVFALLLGFFSGCIASRSPLFVRKTCEEYLHPKDEEADDQEVAELASQPRDAVEQGSDGMSCAQEQLVKSPETDDEAKGNDKETDLPASIVEPDKQHILASDLSPIGFDIEVDETNMRASF